MPQATGAEDIRAAIAGREDGHLHARHNTQRAGRRVFHWPHELCQDEEVLRLTKEVRGEYTTHVTIPALVIHGTKDQISLPANGEANKKWRDLRESYGLPPLPPTVHVHPEAVKECQELMKSVGFRELLDKIEKQKEKEKAETEKDEKDEKKGDK